MAFFSSLAASARILLKYIRTPNPAILPTAREINKLASRGSSPLKRMNTGMASSRKTTTDATRPNRCRRSSWPDSLCSSRKQAAHNGTSMDRVLRPFLRVKAIPSVAGREQCAQIPGNRICSPGRTFTLTIRPIVPSLRVFSWSARTQGHRQVIHSEAAGPFFCRRRIRPASTGVSRWSPRI